MEEAIPPKASQLPSSLPSLDGRHSQLGTGAFWGSPSAVGF